MLDIEFGLDYVIRVSSQDQNKTPSYSPSLKSLPWLSPFWMSLENQFLSYLPRGATIPAPTSSASRSWSDIARGRTRLSLNELPEAYKSKLLKAKKLLQDAGYASLSTPSRSPPAMEARYFSGFKRGPYKQLISLLRNATRNRAVIAISFIGKSILEIVTPKNEADRLVIGLQAIGYRHLSKFEPTKNAISTLKFMSAEERKKKNLELALSRSERAAQNFHPHWAPKWYKQQKKRIRDLILCESFESAMVIDSNTGEESSAHTPNANRSQQAGLKGIGQSPVPQKDIIHQNAITVEVSISFAVLSPAETDGEPLDTDAGNNHMEVEETLPVTNRTADHDNMDVEILQHTSRQISNNEPTKTGHNSSYRSPSTGNDTQDSDADSLGSDWDHDGAPTYDHELRRPKRSTEKGAKNLVTQKELPTKAKKRSKAPLPLRRSKSCCNFVYTPITKNKPPSAPSNSRR